MSGSNGENGKGAPKWEQLLRSKGASDDEIAEARKENDANFTRQRRSDRDRLDQMEQRITQLTQGGVPSQQTATQSNQKMPWDTVLEEHGITMEKAPDLHKAFSKAFTTVFQQAVQASEYLNQQRNAPVQFQNKLASDRNDLVKRFGEKIVEKNWPDIEAEVKTRAQRGLPVMHAEDVFRDALREEYDDAVFVTENARRTRQREETKSKTTEGFQQTQRSQPMAIADGRNDDEQVYDLSADIMNIFSEAAAESGFSL